MGGAKSAEGYSYNDVTPEKNAPDSFIRTGRRRQIFVRIGKKFDDETAAEEHNDGREKRVPPGALYTDKRRTKFVRIGRRIGEQSDIESETGTADDTAPRDRRKVKFVRIGRRPVPFVRIGKQLYPPNRPVDITRSMQEDEPPGSFERRGRRLKFVRIGRSVAEKNFGSRTANEESLHRLKSMVV